MSRPESYIEHLGCRNCKHVFVKREWDYGPELFCTFEAPERPKCGSSSMKGEDFSVDSAGRYNDELSDAGYEAWESWAKGREVNQNGICDFWKAK